MSEDKQIFNCFTELKGEIIQINRQLVEVNAKIGQMDAKIGQMDARMDQMDARMSSLEDKMERGFAEVKQEFDEKLSLVEFGLDAEIQKVYEIALDNQANIEKINKNQINYQVDSVARQQIAEMSNRMEAVECVVQSHSEAIRNLQDEIA